MNAVNDHLLTELTSANFYLFSFQCFIEFYTHMTKKIKIHSIKWCHQDNSLWKSCPMSAINESLTTSMTVSL